jgi:hypothetical protein
MSAGRLRPVERLTVADMIAAGTGLLTLVAGILSLALAGGFAVSLIGISLLGIAGISFAALAFLIVGEGEDRYYEKEQHERERRRPPR